MEINGYDYLQTFQSVLSTDQGRKRLNIAQRVLIGVSLTPLALSSIFLARFLALL